MRIRKVGVVVVVPFLLLELAPVAAQEATEEVTEAEAAPPPSLVPTIAGHVNGTFNYNFMKPVTGINQFHSYSARDNTFLLNAAHVAITGSDERFGYAVEIDAGTDAFVNTLDDDFDIQEAYVTWNSTSGFGFKLGKWATYQGIEVIESPANPTISRGYLFGLAEPFTHVGGVVTYEASDTVDVALGLINGWDLMVDNNDMKTLVAKVGVIVEKLLLSFSGYAGPERASNNDDWRTNLDVTGVYKLDKVDLLFQLLYGWEQELTADGSTAAWAGVGAQSIVRVHNALTIGARAEVFVDSDGVRTGTDQTLFNLSVAPAYNLYGPVTLRAELRVDVSSEDVFDDDDGELGATQFVGLGEAIVLF